MQRKGRDKEREKANSTFHRYNQTVKELSGLIVYPENMAHNLDVTRGSLLAERVMLALGKFIGRQQAHDIIYEAAMESFEKRVSFGDVLKRYKLVTEHLKPEMIDDLLDPMQYTGLAGVYVDRVLGKTQ